MPAESAKRIATIAVLAASCPGILALDLFVVPWQMPTPVLYAIPVLLAARFLGRPATVVLLALALYVQMVDAMLEGADFAVTILAVSSLALIGGIGVLWGDAHARVAQLYELEQERAAELEESRRQLLRFFALVAHDLRGPVTAIRGYSQLLSRADTADEVRQTRIARGVDSATRQLTRLTDDVFEASRVGSGQLELRTSDWDLQLLADEIVEQRRVSAPTHRLVLETTLSVVEGCWDRERIARVLVNLIDNAIKYSPHGGVVTVRIAPADGRARLTVSDQGVGIAPDQIASLFRPYARLGQVDGVAGLGLGLYIVKGIVDAHEGSIWAESRPGEGSTFVVDLPLGVAGRATEPAADADLASVR